jgi:hypothetical protein
MTTILLALRFFTVEIERLHHWRIGEAEQQGGTGPVLTCS